MKKNLFLSTLFLFYSIVSSAQDVWPLTASTILPTNVSGIAGATAYAATITGTATTTFSATGLTYNPSATAGTWPSDNNLLGINGRYIEFTISPNTNSNLNITQVSCNFSRTAGTTIRASIYYYIGSSAPANLTVMTAIATGIAPASTTMTSYSYPTNLYIPDTQKIYIRIYPSSSSTTIQNTRYLNIANLSVNGSCFPGNLNVSPVTLTNFSSSTVSPSSSQSFLLTGTNITGNVNVTPPPSYEINNPLVNGNYYSSLVLSPSSGSINNNINIRLKSGLTPGVYNDVVNIACATANIALPKTVNLVGTCIGTYYYKGVGSLSAFGSWGTNTNGTGTNPIDFTANYQAFYLVNTTNVSTTAPLSIGGPNNRFIIGNGSSPAITLTITSGNPISITSGSTFEILAPSSGNNELIFQDANIPTITSLDPLTKLTYSNGQTGVSIPAFNFNTLKITNNTSITFNTSPTIKFLIVDLGSTIAPSTNLDILNIGMGGNAVVNGKIYTNSANGLFTTDPTSTSKGTLFSTDTNATLTLGCSSTVVYNRGIISAQLLSPLNYANLTIDNNNSTRTAVFLSGIARINGQLQFIGTAQNFFSITTGNLTFGINATYTTSTNALIDFGNQTVTFETNNSLTSGVTISGAEVINKTGAVYTNIIGSLTSVDSAVCPGRNATITIANSTGTFQWQQSSDNVTWTDIASANSSSYTTANLSATGYYRVKVTNSANCSTGYTAVFTITVNTKKWLGSAWNGNALPPSANESIEFQGNYTSTADVIGCSCTVTSGNVIISSGTALKLNDALYVNGGSINFNSGSSLIQTNNTALNTTYDPTKIVFSRSTNAITKFDYTYWSSPVVAQTLSGLSPNTLSDKYFSFDTSTNYWSVENPNNTMIKGKGYIIRAPQSFDPSVPAVFTGDFKGLPNNGTITNPLTGASGTYNLIGNPYPSAIDAELFYEDNNSSIKPNFYFWTHNTPITNLAYTADDYAIYNALLGAGIGSGTTANTGGNAPDNFIDSCQGFFVESLSPATLTFTNTHRVSSNNNAFYKNNTNRAVCDKFWLNLSADSGVFKQQLIGYTVGATNNLDQLYDAQQIDSNSAFEFYSLTNADDKCVIQSRLAPFSTQDTIPLGIKTTFAGEFTIAIDHLDAAFNNQDIYLVDAELGTYVNLKQESYHFYTAAGTNSSRFHIQYAVPSLAVNQVSNTNSVVVYSQNHQINVKSFSEPIETIMVYDVLGRTLLQENNLNANFKILNTLYNQEFVLVIIQLLNGEKITKKIYL